MTNSLKNTNSGVVHYYLYTKDTPSFDATAAVGVSKTRHHNLLRNETKLTTPVTKIFIQPTETSLTFTENYDDIGTISNDVKTSHFISTRNLSVSHILKAAKLHALKFEYATPNTIESTLRYQKSQLTKDMNSSVFQNYLKKPEVVSFGTKHTFGVPRNRDRNIPEKLKELTTPDESLIFTQTTESLLHNKNRYDDRVTLSNKERTHYINTQDAVASHNFEVAKFYSPEYENKMKARLKEEDSSMIYKFEKTEETTAFDNCTTNVPLKMIPGSNYYETQTEAIMRNFTPVDLKVNRDNYYDFKTNAKEKTNYFTNFITINSLADKHSKILNNFNATQNPNKVKLTNKNTQFDNNFESIEGIIKIDNITIPHNKINETETHKEVSSPMSFNSLNEVEMRKDLNSTVVTDIVSLQSIKKDDYFNITAKPIIDGIHKVSVLANVNREAYKPIVWVDASTRPTIKIDNITTPRNEIVNKIAETEIPKGVLNPLSLNSSKEVKMHRDSNSTVVTDIVSIQPNKRIITLILQQSPSPTEYTMYQFLPTSIAKHINHFY